MNDVNTKFRPEVILTKGSKIEKAIIQGIKKRYNLSHFQAELKYRLVKKRLTEAHQLVIKKYKERNEEIQRRQRAKQKAKEEHMEYLLDMEMEDSIHMMQIQSKFYQKLTKFTKEMTSEIPAFQHNQHEHVNLDTIILEDDSTYQETQQKMRLYDKDVKIVVKIGKFRMKLNREDLDGLSSTYRKLDDQYAYLRPHLPRKYKRLFDKLIKFTEFVRIEKSTQPRKILIEVNKSNYLIDKNALKLIKLMMPLGRIAIFLEEVLETQPTQNALLMFIVQRFKEFLTFSHKILFLDPNILSLKGKSGLRRTGAVRQATAQQFRSDVSNEHKRRELQLRRAQYLKEHSKLMAERTPSAEEDNNERDSQQLLGGDDSGQSELNKSQEKLKEVYQNNSEMFESSERKIMGNQPGIIREEEEIDYKEQSDQQQSLSEKDKSLLFRNIAVQGSTKQPMMGGEEDRSTEPSKLSTSISTSNQAEENTEKMIEKQRAQYGEQEEVKGKSESSGESSDNREHIEKQNRIRELKIKKRERQMELIKDIKKRFQKYMVDYTSMELNKELNILRDLSRSYLGIDPSSAGDKKMDKKGQG